MATVGEPSGASPEEYRRALRASEARFRLLIERNADGTIVVRRGDGIIRYVSLAACALLRREAEDLVGEPFGIPIIPGETTEIDLPVGGDAARVAEMRVVETEWDGEPVFLASLRDVTERKQLEDELRRRAHELAEANRRKDEFLAMLAHELRNPLAPILTAIRIMGLRPADGAIQGQMREVVERQARTMARLIDDLLDVSRLSRGKITLRTEPVELAGVVQRAVEVALAAIEGRRLELAVVLPPGPLAVQADPMRLEQVLTNLLNNAAKYTDPGGSITLEVEPDGDEVVVRVRDTGIGMTAEMLPHVFDLFAQADRSLDRSQGGLGIGLTLVRKLVELHGGTVGAESPGLGRGSTFTVRLPRLRDGLPVASGDGKAPAPHPARSLRVLIVDDNAIAAEGLSALLRLWGHETSVAFDGHAAIERALAVRPHVVLLDIGLPGLDGYAVARRLSGHPELRSTLLVAISGYGGDEDRRRCWEAGFHHHMVKPVDLDLLEHLLAGPEPLSSRAGEASRA